jgi:hypothetical protein
MVQESILLLRANQFSHLRKLGVHKLDLQDESLPEVLS